MERRTELDTLRGLFLIVMTITHLPTHFSQYSSHLFGFVSAAEGFVFLSAFLVGKIYMRKMNRTGVEPVRESLMQRARQLYSWHLGLILFAFTIATLLALMGGRPALRNMLDFYIQKPVSALLGAPLLLYQPPLLDILPMYVVFIALTPGVLAFALRRGWTRLLTLSALLWLFAQFDGRLLMLQAVNWLTHLDIAPNALGAFDWFAWQALWIAALWAGARTSSEHQPLRVPRAAVIAGFIGAAGFLAWYHDLGGFWPKGEGTPLFDKTKLGALRLADFATLAIVATYALLPVLRWLKPKAVTMLGQASLHVFAAHLLLCMVALALIGRDQKPLNHWQELLVLAVTFGAMFWVAWRQKQLKRRAREQGQAAAPKLHIAVTESPK